MRRAIARGRIFPQSYSTDRRYGRISLKAIGLFPLMWGNADDQGRLCGDPEEIKYSCCPNVDHITKADIPDILLDLTNNSLILLYTTPKCPAIQMLDWWEVQKLQWAWPSDYPPPDGWKDRLRYKLSAKEYVSENWENAPTVDKPVYFIVDQEAMAVKIGVADSPEDRLQELQHGNPHRLRLARVISGGGYRLEGELHRRFAKYALTTEWFRLTDAIMSCSPEPSPEETDRSPLPTPSEEEKEEETEDRRGRGRGNSPERQNGAHLSVHLRNASDTPLVKTSPTTTGNNSELLEELTSCFKMRWGSVKASDPETIIPRVPGGKMIAQLRDLAEELAGYNCPLSFIREAFDECKEVKQQKISYARAILLDWIGVKR